LAAQPFLAKYDPEAIWYTDLEPAFGEGRFFFKDELDLMLRCSLEIEPEDFG
jgi:hypothetical protein